MYALATGNTTILKASELAPRSHWAIGSVFKEAGLPDGCLNILAHRPQDAVEVTNTLIEHPEVKKINFTGSTAVGSIIASVAGKNLKPCLMELGGKASAIVLPNADIKRAAAGCALGAFVNVRLIFIRIIHTLLTDTLIEWPSLHVNRKNSCPLFHSL